MTTSKHEAFEKRKTRVRYSITGTADRPRLSVFRSNKTMYGQIINDAEQKTLVSVSPADLGEAESKKTTKTELAKKIGLKLAEKAKEKNVSLVVFDRGAYKYHGRVKAFAEGAREGGLDF